MTRQGSRRIVGILSLAELYIHHIKSSHLSGKGGWNSYQRTLRGVLRKTHRNHWAPFYMYVSFIYAYFFFCSSPSQLIETNTAISANMYLYAVMSGLSDCSIISSFLLLVQFATS